MQASDTSWVRLIYNPSSGEVTAEGNLEGILSITAEELNSLENPIDSFSGSIASALTEGGTPFTDSDTGLFVIPDCTGLNNSVTLVKTGGPEIDLVSDMAAGIVGFSPDGSIMRWNRRMSYLFGPREKDVLGRKAEDVLPAPVLYDWTSVISSAHIGHEVRIEFRPSGDKRIDGMLSQGGTGVIGIFTDSTEVYKTGKRLRALNRLNQAYLQSTTTGILLLDSHFRILLSNPGFGIITGERGSLIGQQLHDVLPENSYKWVHDSTERLYGDEQSELSEVLPFRKRDGSLLTIKHILRVVRNGINQAVNYVCLFQDRTEISVLREENRKLRRGLEGISRLAEELKTGEKRDSNSFCDKILGITGSEAVVEFSYDQSETLRQSGCAGKWPSEFSFEHIASLGFPASVWSSGVVCTVGQSELGRLASVFTSCTIIPVGSGAGSMGFIMLCNSSITDSEQSILKLIALLPELSLELQKNCRSLSSSEGTEIRCEALLSDFLGSVPLPVCVLTRDNRPVYWNPEMERITGITKEMATPEKVQSIIDPSGVGFSLDSLSAAGTLDMSSNSLVWKVKKLDGTMSRPFRWHVSILEHPELFKGDYGFILTGLYPKGYAVSTAEKHGNSVNSLSILSTFTRSVLSDNKTEIFKSVWDIAQSLDCCSGLHFFRDGKAAASFPEDSEQFRETNGEACAILIMDYAEYEVRPSGNANLPVLESICELVSSIRAARLTDPLKKGLPDNPMMANLALLIDAFQDIATESMRQGNALLNLVEKSDPFSGFARTIVLSQESALRISELVKLSFSVNSTLFRKVSLQRFMSGFPSGFVERGLRPPSLSLSDSFPQVMIIPEVVLNSVSSLCRILTSDSVIGLAVESDTLTESPSVLLKITGLAEMVTEEKVNRGSISLDKGVFDIWAEIAFISSLLEEAGCRIVSSPEAQCTVLFTRAEL